MTKKPINTGKQDPKLDISDLSHVYRAGAEEQPPSRVDAAILAQARKAVGASRSYSPFGASWSTPLSAAAVVVLSVVLVIFMSRETPLPEQTLSENPPIDSYSVEKSQTPKRTEEADHAGTPPMSPASGANAPTAASEPAAKKESRMDKATANDAVATHERAAGAAQSKSAVSKEADTRLLAKPLASGIVNLQVGDRTIRAELAVTDTELERGLMHREQLAPDRGMLFFFPPRGGSVCMWMKNTWIPLSAAFLDSKGAVLKIADMQPMSETAHCAYGDVRYVLEVNQGMFAEAGVKSGTRIGGLPPMRD